MYIHMCTWCMYVQKPFEHWKLKAFEITHVFYRFISVVDLFLHGVLR